jgi:hypothetical protein
MKNKPKMLNIITLPGLELLNAVQQRKTDACRILVVRCKK